MKNYKQWPVLKSINILLILFLLQPGAALAQNVPMPTGWACGECGASAPVGTAVQHKSTCSAYRGGVSGGGGTQGTSRPSAGEQRIAKASTVISKGDAQYKAGNYKKAIAFYRRAYWYDPNDESLLKKIKDAKERKANSTVRTSKPTQSKPTNSKPPVSTKPDDSNISKEAKKIKKEYDSYNEHNLSDYISQQKTLRKTLASYVPPLEGFKTKKKIPEGIILGLMNTTDVNDVAKVTSPITGHAFKKGEYFATTDNASVTDFFRVAADNITIGKYTLNTEYGKKLIAELNGTHFERLFAHSNGATVTEAMINENIIKVDELNILGGDRSCINIQGYKDLVASGKVKKIIVWYNPADIVPYGTSAKLLHPYFAIKERKEFMALYEDHYKNNLQNIPGVEFRRLKGPEYSAEGQNFATKLSSIFDAHYLTAYFDNMNRWQRVH